MTNVLNSNVSVKGSYVETGFYNNGASLLTINETYPTVAETRTITRSGGNTPGYHNPKRTGSLKPTSFSYYKSVNLGEVGYDATKSITLKPNQYGYKDLVQKGVFGGQAVASGGGISQSDIDRLKGQSTNGALSKIKSQSVNVAQALAESNQTYRLIGDVALRLAGSYRALRRGNIHEAARHLGVDAPKRAASRFKAQYPVDPSKAASRAWLELQYGWKPLVSDVYGMAEQLAKANNRPSTSTVTSRKTLVQPIFYYVSSKSGQLTSVQSRTGEAKVVVITKIVYRVNSPTQATAKEIGLTNPLLIAWELLPFSFVADWFIPLGSYIGNFDATLGCAFESGYQTVFQKSQSKALRSLDGVDSGYQRNMLKWSSQEMVRVDRTVLTGFPSNVFPPFKNPASVLHCANAIALLTQLFRK